MGFYAEARSHRELTHRVVVLDIETTGLMPQRGHRIIEIGAVALQENQVIAEFQSLIHVQGRMPRQAQQIHGISDEMLQKSPGPDIVLPQFYEFIRQSTLVAHNAKFDMVFLRYEMRRFQLSLPHPTICTLKLSRKRYPFLPNHRLETVARHLFGKLPNGIKRHRALDDARLAAKVWLAMCGEKVKQPWEDKTDG